MVVADDAFVGLAELLANLVRETGEAVHRAQLAQSDSEADLKALVSLDVAAAAEKLVSEEDALALQQQILIESDADVEWDKRHDVFLKLVESRLGVRLSANDYNKTGLAAAGQEKIVAAARQNLAVEQLQAVRRLLGEGTHRVKISSGAISVKVVMQAQGGAKPAKVAMTALVPAKTGPNYHILDAARSNSEMRILVRPAHDAEGERSGVFGEVKINFVVV